MNKTVLISQGIKEPQLINKLKTHFQFNRFLTIFQLFYTIFKTVLAYFWER